MSDYPGDWERRRQTVFERDGYRCLNCGIEGGPDSDTSLHAHHIVPKSQGGSHAPRNLATLCAACHHDVHRSRGTASSPRLSSILRRLYRANRWTRRSVPAVGRTVHLVVVIAVAYATLAGAATLLATLGGDTTPRVVLRDAVALPEALVAYVSANPVWVLAAALLAYAVALTERDHARKQIAAGTDADEEDSADLEQLVPVGVSLVLLSAFVLLRLLSGWGTMPIDGWLFVAGSVVTVGLFLLTFTQLVRWDHAAGRTGSAAVWDLLSRGAGLVLLVDVLVIDSVQPLGHRLSWAVLPLLGSAYLVYRFLSRD